MLACLSHASRWTPVDVSHPVGADALQCLAAKLAAEGAATPPDLSGFTAGEAREMFPCLREWSECFTKAFVFSRGSWLTKRRSGRGMTMRRNRYLRSRARRRPTRRGK